MAGFELIDGSLPCNTDWVALLRPEPTQALRKFDRVAHRISGRVSRQSNGLYMKRVAAAYPVPASDRLLSDAVPFTFFPGMREIDQVEVESAKRADKTRRSDTYTNPLNDCLFSDKKRPTDAVIAYEFNVATTEVANTAVQEGPTVIMPHDRLLARNGQLVHPTVTKRHPRNGFKPAVLRYNGGRIIQNQKLLPALEKAIDNNGSVDRRNVAIEMGRVRLQHMRRNLRTPLAEAGQPDLSVIFDETEPEEVSHIEINIPTTLRANVPSTREPEELMSKRLPGTVDTEVDSIADAPNGPTKVFSAPSYEDSTTTNGAEAESSLLLSVEDSPVKTPFTVGQLPPDVVNNIAEEAANTFEFSPVQRPGAPTPSKWDRLEPGQTEFIKSHDQGIKQGPATPSRRTEDEPSTPFQSRTPPGLLDCIPPTTPRCEPLPSSYNAEPLSSPMPFNFGEITPIGAHTTRKNKGLQGLTQNERRRQSEPLLKQHLRSQAVRHSLSPEKMTQREVPRPSTPIRDEGLSVRSDVSTPLPSYFAAGNPLSAAINDFITTPAYEKKHVYNIDMRKNPDIFGTQPIDAGGDSPVKTATEQEDPSAFAQSAVERLAKMAEGYCDGLAKVQVLQENGRLVVRFKLPAKYATMFPNSQGSDESRFTTTPSAISSSPRITFPALSAGLGMDIARPIFPRTNSHEKSGLEAVDGFTSPQHSSPPSKCQDVSSSLSILDQTPPHPSSSANQDDMYAPTALSAEEDTHEDSMSDSGVVPEETEEVDGMSVGSDEDSNNLDAAPGSPSKVFDPSLLNHISAVLGMASNASSPISNKQSSFRTRESLCSPSDFVSVKWGQSAPLDTPRALQIEDQTLVVSGFCDSPLAVETPKQASYTESPTSTNGKAMDGPEVPSSDPHINDIVPSSQSEVLQPEQSFSETNERCFTPVNKSSPPQAAAAQSMTHEQTKSPNPGSEETSTRQYVMDFIRRSKPKRTSTTETGSPMPMTISPRVPLGAKSPNTSSDSPEKRKRKSTSEDAEGSPKKKIDQSSVPNKKSRRVGSYKSTANKKTTEADIEVSLEETTLDLMLPTHGTVDDTPGGLAARRSSRLQDSRKATQIPTAIRINPSSGVGPRALPISAAVRTEQAELARRTNSNTRRNRFKAETVAQVLSRSSDELSGEDSSESGSSQNKGGKTVTWKTPIESYQDEKSKKGKIPTKPKPTIGSTGVTKKPAGQRGRPSKVAQNLGMVANGTPAKRVTRVTRSSNRSAQ